MAYSNSMVRNCVNENMIRSKVNGSKYWRYNSTLLCVCGSDMFARNSSGCELICDSSWTGYTVNLINRRCKCLNGKVGLGCQNDVCRLGRAQNPQFFCGLSSDSLQCEYLDRDRSWTSYPECSCEQNAAKGNDGFCVCPHHYEGLRCETYNNNPLFADGNTDVVSVYPSKINARNSTFMYGILWTLLGTLLLFLCCYLCIRQSRRRNAYRFGGVPYYSTSDAVPMTNTVAAGDVHNSAVPAPYPAQQFQYYGGDYGGANPNLQSVAGYGDGAVYGHVRASLDPHPLPFYHVVVPHSTTTNVDDNPPSYEEAVRNKN